MECGAGRFLVGMLFIYHKIDCRISGNALIYISNIPNVDGKSTSPLDQGHGFGAHLRKLR
jgi:hypothetical protein